MNIDPRLQIPANADPDTMWEILEAGRDLEAKARAKLEGKDPDWEARKEVLRQRMTMLINMYKMDDPATKAVFILGQVQAIAAELEAPRILTLQFEVLRERYKKATGE